MRNCLGLVVKEVEVAVDVDVNVKTLRFSPGWPEAEATGPGLRRRNGYRARAASACGQPCECGASIAWQWPPHPPYLWPRAPQATYFHIVACPANCQSLLRTTGQFPTTAQVFADWKGSMSGGKDFQVVRSFPISLPLLTAFLMDVLPAAELCRCRRAPDRRGSPSHQF